MDFPIIISWVGPPYFLGESGVVLNFYSLFDELSLSIQNSPRWDTTFCGVTFGAILFAYVPQKRYQAYESQTTKKLGDSWCLHDMYTPEVVRYLR